MKFHPITILYYHRIGSVDPIHLSIPKNLFEKQILFLKKYNYNVITLSELFHLLKTNKFYKNPCVLITFDDGFRDIYTNAFPILKKYKVKANVFIITDFIRENSFAGDITSSSSNKYNKCYVDLDFYNSYVEAIRGNFQSFLSYQEIYEMKNSGLIEFHSHTVSHNQVFCSNRITGFFPITEKHWGIHSAYRNVLNENNVMPIFERCSGLLKPAYFPKIDLLKNFTYKIIKNNKKDLSQIKNLFILTRLDEKYFEIENYDKYMKRVLNELIISKEVCEKINKNELFLCWPWGQYNKSLVELALKVGYIGTVTTKNGVIISNEDIITLPRFAVKKPFMIHFILGLILRKNVKLFKLYSRINSLCFKKIRA